MANQPLHGNDPPGHHDGGGPVSRRLPIGVPTWVVLLDYPQGVAPEHMFESVCQYASPPGLSDKPMILQSREETAKDEMNFVPV